MSPLVQQFCVVFMMNLPPCCDGMGGYHDESTAFGATFWVVFMMNLPPWCNSFGGYDELTPCTNAVKLITLIK